MTSLSVVVNGKPVKRKKVYLAGPMRGISEFNFPAFHAAARKLRAEGYDVFSPAEKDIERHGVDISAGNTTGDEEYASKQHGFSLREALGIDLAWICKEADAIALLPGWMGSRGARAEKATADALGLEVIKLERDCVKFCGEDCYCELRASTPSEQFAEAA